MLTVYGGLFIIALLMALTEKTYRHGGEDKKQVVAVTKSDYKAYQQESARGRSGGGRVYVGGGYSYGK